MAPFENRPAALTARSPTVRWFKEWVPQDLLVTGGKCMVLKWITGDVLKALKEKLPEPESKQPEPEPEPELTTEVLFLCSHKGCGKTFVDAAALRKHSHTHGDRKYVCHYEGCGKKFLDSSKLKRHFLTHTGERNYVCTYEGCGKAFSLDFNLRAHMRTHSQENYHVCPYEDCGKRYAHSYKLQAHVKVHHEKNTAVNITKLTPAEERVHVPWKPAAAPCPDRPYACPYEGCGKSYIHEYKLKLHLRREHDGHSSEAIGKRTPSVEHGMGGAYVVGKRTPGKNLKRSKPTVLNTKLQPPKVARKASPCTRVTLDVAKEKWPVRKAVNEDDREETEEDFGNSEEDGWRYQWENGDDEETEDEE